MSRPNDQSYKMARTSRIIHAIRVKVVRGRRFDDIFIFQFRLRMSRLKNNCNQAENPTMCCSNVSNVSSAVDDDGEDTVELEHTDLSPLVVSPLAQRGRSAWSYSTFRGFTRIAASDYSFMQLLTLAYLEPLLPWGCLEPLFLWFGLRLPIATIREEDWPHNSPRTLAQAIKNFDHESDLRRRFQNQQRTHLRSLVFNWREERGWNTTGGSPV